MTQLAFVKRFAQNDHLRQAIAQMYAMRLRSQSGRAKPTADLAVGDSAVPLTGQLVQNADGSSEEAASRQPRRQHNNCLPIRLQNALDLA